ncbi:hypothetical protein BJ912DRAFT_933164 [Pholiota molesta]|nr:hypothetical protein BJ912DRAFT_933164 [Pholiota molesta]
MDCSMKYMHMRYLLCFVVIRNRNTYSYKDWAESAHIVVVDASYLLHPPHLAPLRSCRLPPSPCRKNEGHGGWTKKGRPTKWEIHEVLTLAVPPSGVLLLRPSPVLRRGHTTAKVHDDETPCGQPRRRQPARRLQHRRPDTAGMGAIGGPDEQATAAGRPVTVLVTRTDEPQHGHDERGHEYYAGTESEAAGGTTTRAGTATMDSPTTAVTIRRYDDEGGGEYEDGDDGGEYEDGGGGNCGGNGGGCNEYDGGEYEDSSDPTTTAAASAKRRRARNGGGNNDGGEYEGGSNPMTSMKRRRQRRRRRSMGTSAGTHGACARMSATAGQARALARERATSGLSLVGFLPARNRCAWATFPLCLSPLPPPHYYVRTPASHRSSGQHLTGTKTSTLLLASPELGVLANLHRLRLLHQEDNHGSIKAFDNVETAGQMATARSYKDGRLFDGCGSMACRANTFRMAANAFATLCRPLSTHQAAIDIASGSDHKFNGNFSFSPSPMRDKTWYIHTCTKFCPACLHPLFRHCLACLAAFDFASREFQKDKGGCEKTSRVGRATLAGSVSQFLNRHSPLPLTLHRADITKLKLGCWLTRNGCETSTLLLALPELGVLALRLNIPTSSICFLYVTVHQTISYAPLCTLHHAAVNTSAWYRLHCDHSFTPSWCYPSWRRLTSHQATRPLLGSRQAARMAADAFATSCWPPSTQQFAVDFASGSAQKLNGNTVDTSGRHRLFASGWLSALTSLPGTLSSPLPTCVTIFGTRTFQILHGPVTPGSQCIPQKILFAMPLTMLRSSSAAFDYALGGHKQA